MSTSPNYEFLEVPFEGAEPLGIIAINVGVLTSCVSCSVFYPGLRPFSFEPKIGTDTTVDFGTEVKGFPLHFYPTNLPADVAGFEKPPLSPGVALESILTKFLVNLRSEFDASMKGVPLWDLVKERARVMFTHPFVWDAIWLRAIRQCIDDAGWLNGGKRPLEMVSEEETMVADHVHWRRSSSKPVSTTFVAISECGSSAMSLICLEGRDPEKPWAVRSMWNRGVCNAGFAVAYDAAKSKSRFIPRTQTHYNLSFHTRRIVRSDGYTKPGDVIVPEDEANKYIARSVAPIIELVKSILTPRLSNACPLFCGNYIATAEVKSLIFQRFNGPNMTPDARYRESNRISLYFNMYAFFFHLFDAGLLKTLPPRTDQYQSLKLSSLDLGAYEVFQWTDGGAPPDISLQFVATPPVTPGDVVPQPPNPDITANINNIRESARVCYTHIRPWRSAETGNVLLAPVVEDMKQCFASYRGFLADSLDAAESGHSVSAKCEKLCKKLQAGIQGEELRQIVLELQTMIKGALEDAKKTKSSFSSVRQSVIKAQTLTSQTVEGLRDLRASFEAVRLLDRNSEPLPERVGTPTQSPIPVANKVTTPMSSQEANSDIFRVAQTLDLLQDHLGFVIDWWLEAESRLALLGKRADKMTIRIVKLEVRSSITDWRVIKVAYLEYQYTINSLLETET